MSIESTRKDNIQAWLNNDEWKWNKEHASQQGTPYTITSKNNDEFQLLLDGNVDKITLSYKYPLSSDLQKLVDLKQDFIYEIKVDLLPMDIYLKSDNDNNNFELKSVIFWEDGIRNKLLHSIYKMDQVIGLCKIKDKLFVRNHQPNSKV